MYKLASINLCSNVDGQLMMGMSCNPPREGDESYERYAEERDGILASLQRRATLIVDGLNGLEGVACNKTQGALYAFPQIELPAAAVSAAKAAGKAPDAMSALSCWMRRALSWMPWFRVWAGRRHIALPYYNFAQEEDMGDVVVAMRHFMKILCRYQ